MKLFFLICLACTFTFAQKVTIDLDKAIEIALKNNKQHKISKVAVDIAKAQYQQANSLNYPILDISVAGMREKEDRKFIMKGKLENVPIPPLMPGLSPINISLPINTEVKAMGRDTVYSSLNILYPLYTGGKISSLIKQAELNKLIAKSTIEREKENVIFDIKKYYYAYVLQASLYELVEKLHNRMEFVSSITKDFYENGGSLNVKKTDYLNIQLVVTLIKTSLTRIKLNQDILKSALINTMGLHWNSNIIITNNNSKVTKYSHNLDNLIKLASESNADISKMKLVVQITDEQIKEAKAGHYPDIALKGSITNIYNSYEFGMLNEDQKNFWDIGFVAKIPIFNGNRTSGLVKEKKMNKRKVLLLEEMVEEGTALKIHNEFLSANAFYSQIKILTKAKDIAIKNRMLNTKGYEIDIITPKQVIESQYMEMYTKVSYLKSLYDYKLSLAKIDKLIGKD